MCIKIRSEVQGQSFWSGVRGAERRSPPEAETFLFFGSHKFACYLIFGDTEITDICPLSSSGTAMSMDL